MSVPSDKIDVLLVDDHAVVRAGYKTFLSLSDKVGVIYEAERGESACQLYSQYQPDIVIMDLSMPGMGGLESIRRLVSRDAHCKILVSSIHNELVYITRVIKAGAKGYITKNSAPETLMAAVYQVASGNTFIEPALAQQLAINVASDRGVSSQIEVLSPREFDVFCLLANGMTTRDAAEKLCLSYKTVCNHTTALKEKLGIKTLAELALIAARQGILETFDRSSMAMLEKQ
ncbi:MAG: response regulator transcription factor [Proteobacteria bacterium]|nr:response regulator transcription factor [Pseudomonadota bacterium]